MGALLNCGRVSWRSVLDCDVRKRVTTVHTSARKFFLSLGALFEDEPTAILVQLLSCGCRALIVLVSPKCLDLSRYVYPGSYTSCSYFIHFALAPNALFSRCRKLPAVCSRHYVSPSEGPLISIAASLCEVEFHYLGYDACWSQGAPCSSTYVRRQVTGMSRIEIVYLCWPYLVAESSPQGAHWIAISLIDRSHFSGMQR